jgi:SOS response associated peptidase (SRAP)
VPVDAFYEWKRTGKSKQPIHIGMRDDSLFAFAGIWDRWRDANANLIETFSILTTTSNSLLAEVHDRMPVILEPEDYELWLDPGSEHLDTLTGMMKPFDPTLMKFYPVSTLVNSPANDDSACATEVEPPHCDTANLFQISRSCHCDERLILRGASSGATLAIRVTARVKLGVAHDPGSSLDGACLRDADYPSK